MTRLFKINGVGCLIVLIVSAILVVLNWDRITFVARNLGAMFDGVEAAETLRSVDGLLDFIDANRSHVSLVAYRLDDPDSAIPSCAKTQPSRHRRKNCASRNQAKNSSTRTGYAAAANT